ncbi:MAG: hypothetical protein RIR91_1855 [Verrucomicrobiota bacterium]
MISNDVGEGSLRRDASNRAQLPAVLAPPVEDAPADQRATQVTKEHPPPPPTGEREGGGEA